MSAFLASGFSPFERKAASESGRNKVMRNKTKQSRSSAEVEEDSRWRRRRGGGGGGTTDIISVLGALMETWPASSLLHDDPHPSFTHEVIFFFLLLLMTKNSVGKNKNNGCYGWIFIANHLYPRI